MSVNTTENVISYACDGDKTDFDFPYKITGTDTSVLQVTLWEDSTGTATTLAEESGAYSYSVSAPNNNYENGGTVSTTELDGVTYVAYAWAAGYTITIERIVPYTQPSEFAAGGLDPVALENTFDQQEYQIQQLDKRKSIHGPASDPITSIYELPMISARESKVLGFDADGNAIAVANVPTSGVSATAFAETLLDDTTAAVARGTLGLDKDDTVEFQTLRTIISPVNPMHSDFGALGNGVHDDSAAFQNALNTLSSTGGKLWFPSRTFKLETGLTIPVGVHIVFEGEGSDSILNFTGTGNAITATGTGANRAFGTYRDFKILGNANMVNGLDITYGTRRTSVENVCVETFNANGIKMNWSFGSILLHCSAKSRHLL